MASSLEFLVGHESEILQKFESLTVWEPNLGCQIWIGGCTNFGYGCIRIARRNWSTHRVAYFLHYGIFDPSFWVCHHCDNPPCINPRHLFLGRGKDNIWDKIRKGRERWAHGEAHYSTRMTAQDIRRVFEMRNEGLTQQKIANDFGLTQPAIQAILCGRNWKCTTRDLLQPPRFKARAVTTKIYGSAVDHVKTLSEEGWSCRRLARHFNVSKSTIWWVLKGADNRKRARI